MIGSWPIDQFIYGSIILIIVPVVVFIYREFIKNKGDK